MSRPCRIGFNINPRWVENGKPGEFLHPLIQAGLTTLEYELDAYLPEWSGVEPLIEACSTLGLQMCFHAPYRLPNRIEGFSGERRAEIIALFRPMLAIAEGWAGRRGETLTVVAHGAVSRSRRREELQEDTRQFLAWTLDEFPHLQIALENAHPPAPGEIKVGDTRAGVVEIVKQLDHPRLGICWDLGHDYLSGPPERLDPEWVSRVVHAHVHDVNEQGVDHFPLIYGRVPYAAWLAPLRAPGSSPTVVLEIKGGLLAGWSGAAITQALVDSISAVREVLG